MSSFTKISPEFLKSIHNGHEHTPDVYFHSNIGVRWLFWERFNQITKFIEQNKNLKKQTCLDFGGGSGIFLPTLSKLFDEVILVDLEPSQAKVIKKEFNLDNCKIIEEDIFKCDFKDIDCIIAADVIEHFDDTSKIIHTLSKFMSKDSYLITSLPTEYKIYEFMRFVFREDKPIDHYFGADEIEHTIENIGFSLLRQKKLLPPSPLSFFSVSMGIRTSNTYA